MKKLWGGRFGRELDPVAKKFSYSLGVDRELLSAEILVSKAYVKMLSRVKLLTSKESDKMIRGLEIVFAELKNISPGRLVEQCEDIHTLIQSTLEEKIGVLAGKIHTGRSRNDLVATSTRIYIRDYARNLNRLFSGFQGVLVAQAKKFHLVFLPGYTHLQRAQIICLAHYFLAYVEMFERDKMRLADAINRMNECPLGSGALAGSGLPLDREFIARELGFRKPASNSLDAVSDRDFVIEILSVVATGFLHLSRFAEDMILWSSQEFGFVELDDRFSTGSSLMPHKKNPDMLELVRGKTGEAVGHLVSALVTMKGLPLAYNRDMQEDKKPLFAALSMLKDSLEVLTGTVKTLSVNSEKCRKACDDSFLYATDLLEYLVRKKVAFREAHEIIGQVVRCAIESKAGLSGLPLRVYQKFSNAFQSDLFDLFDPETSVSGKMTMGSTNPDLVQEQIRIWERRLSSKRKSI